MNSLGLVFDVLEDTEKYLLAESIFGRVEIKCGHDLRNDYVMTVLFYPLGKEFGIAMNVGIPRIAPGLTLDLTGMRQELRNKFEAFVKQARVEGKI